MAGMRVGLTVIEGPEKGRTFSFDEPENFLLGRNAEGSEAHLKLSPDDTYVSRNHFLLEINPPDCFIRAPMGSSLVSWHKSMFGK